MQKPKLQWITQESDSIGNAYGYASHNREMRRSSAEYIDIDDEAPVALTIVPADKFIRVPGKINVLFTMFETTDLPTNYMKAINAADAIIVPCKFCRDLFKRYTTKPIYICHEGVNPDIYRYHKRRPPASGEKFRFLWCGAANPRKGYPVILEAIKVFEAFENVEIYLKTTVKKTSWWDTVKLSWKNRDEIFKKSEYAKDVRKAMIRSWQRMPKKSNADALRKYGKNDNVIFDSRKLPLDDLIALYNSAHCFVLPSFGEGWGLTLCEAMATGAPAISIEATGCAEFFDDTVGYPIKWDKKDIRLENYELVTQCHIPDTVDCIDQMFHVIKNYDKALKKGKKASERINSKFTWDQAGQRLGEIIKEIYARQLESEVANV